MRTNRTITTVIAASAIIVGASLANANANEITGVWKTASGALAKISACGSAFCTKLTSGQYSGRQIGKVKKQGAKYVGTITDPADNKSYSGSATVNGNKLKMTGCAYKIFCKSQTWTRQ